MVKNCVSVPYYTGSQVSCITKNLMQLVQGQVQYSHSELSGIGNTQCQTKKCIIIEIFSIKRNAQFIINCAVVEKIT